MDRLHELQTNAASQSIKETEELSSKSNPHGKVSVNTSKVNASRKNNSHRRKEPSTAALQNNMCLTATDINISNTDAHLDNNSGSISINNNNSKSDEEQIMLIQEAMQEAENKMKWLSATFATSVVAESCNNSISTTINSSSMQETFSNTQLLLDKCATLIQGYDNKKPNAQESSTLVRMRERVSAHLHRKLNTLRQQLWIAEDEWRRRRVENVARQLWLRFGHTSLGKANANMYLSNINNYNTQEDGELVEPVYSPPRGADLFNKEDMNVLAEALVYAERDDAIFSISTYEIREAVERYNMVCNIEDKMRRLHHLFSELNWQVNAQDDDLHNIAQNVDATHVKVLNAREQLQRAKKYHSRCGCGCCCSMM